MSEYKLDMSKYTIDEQPIMWSDEEYRLAFQSLYFEYHKLKSERDQYKTERDTLIDDIAVLKANISRLEWTLKNKEDEIDWFESKIEKLARENVYHEKENKALRLQSNTYFDEWQTLKHENKRLKRLTHKLTTHRTMWDNLKDWRRDMLEIDKNDTQLISLGLVMDDLEKRHLYKECD